MSHVVLLAGSPGSPSRSATLLDSAALLLSSYGISIRLFTVRDFPAEDLILARWDSPAVQRFNQAVAQSDALIIATPVYKAAYSGALKTILDLLPERALENKSALALATGGSPGHLLALDYALQPLLSALKARHIVGGVYATDKDFTAGAEGLYQISLEIKERLHNAIELLISQLPNQSRLRTDELSRQIQAARISI
ncbi:MAG: NADPH-dependent FMN reductase [Iodobacter sp.]